ncbi:hypothetical protein [Methylobacterium sp. CM6247]
MGKNARYAQLIPMVRGVLEALDSGIEADEIASADLAGIAYALPGGQSEVATLLLHASRQLQVKALQMHGKRAALLAEYGLA